MDRYPTPDMDRYAGVLDRRVEALLFDGLIAGGAMLALGYVLGTVFVGSGDGGLGGMLLASWVAPFGIFAYQIGFEGYYGQTLGKYLRGIVVVKEDGSDLTWGGAVIRNVLRIVDGLPAFYVFGIVVAYLSDNHQRLGDIAGNTVVVYTDS